MNEKTLPPVAQVPTCDSLQKGTYDDLRKKEHNPDHVKSINDREVQLSQGQSDRIVYSLEEEGKVRWKIDLILLPMVRGPPSSKPD
jgi:hypothetical protein